MEAVRFHPPGGFDKLKLGKEPVPIIDDDELLIEVDAVGVIWTEFFWPIYQKADGTYVSHIPGHDYSGIIREVGSQAKANDNIYVGAEVMVFTSKRDNEGGLARYAKAHACNVALKPRSLTLTESASVPLSALTSWQALFDHGKLVAGQTLLVTGAAGATAIWAVQLGKMVGARVIGTASSDRSFELLKSLGIDKVLNYKETRLDTALENVDLVFDTIGGDTALQSLRTLKTGGLLVNINDPAIGNISEGVGSRAMFFIVSMNTEQLNQISSLIDEDKLKPVVDSVFSFEDFGKAFEKGAAGHSHGRILIKGPEK